MNWFSKKGYSAPPTGGTTEADKVRYAAPWAHCAVVVTFKNRLTRTAYAQDVNTEWQKLEADFLSGSLARTKYQILANDVWNIDLSEVLMITITDAVIHAK